MDRDLHPAAVAPSAVAVVLHPHPAMGGDRHHPLVVEIASRLAERGVTALRLDLIDPDLETSAIVLTDAADALRAEVGVERVFLIGYSWGSVVSVLAAPDALAARVLIAPPVSMLAAPQSGDVPTLVLVPEHDQFGGPDPVRAAMRDWAGVTIEVVENADHFVAGAVTRIAGRAVDWLAP